MGKATYEEVPIGQLSFELDNPRFKNHKRHIKTQDEAYDLLISEYGALELIDSFLENGFIPYEPLIVRRSKDSYVVVEGNRRLAAIQYLLKHPDQYSDKKDKIEGLRSVPALIFGAGDSAADERAYLGVRHIAGFKEWEPEAKAFFLDEHIKKAGDVERMMRELSVDKREIERYLIPFRLSKKAGLSSSAKQDFWRLAEALGRMHIKEYIEIDIDSKTLSVKGFNPKKFKQLGFFLEKRISDTRELSLLNKILNSKLARQELEKGGTLESAQIYLENKKEDIPRLIKKTRSNS